MKIKNSNNSKEDKSNLYHSKVEMRNNEVEIDDNEIEELLKDFHIEEIDIPEYFDEKLNIKLESIRPKKKNSLLKILIACSLAAVISYTYIPYVKTFANEVIKLFLGDMGIQNASDNGYEKIQKQILTIGDFKIEIDNIYLDELRLNFDAYLTNPKVDFDYDKGEIHTVVVKNRDGISSTTSFNIDKGKGMSSNIQLMGEGITKLYETRETSFEIELVVEKSYNRDSDINEIKYEEVGSSKLIIEIPDEIYKKENKKIYNINQTIDTNNSKIEIKDLEVSPTMMYLDTKANIEGSESTSGLYNLSITSEKNYVYKDTMAMSGVSRKDNDYFRQTIVPSIFYDTSKKIKLKADGVIVKPEAKNMELKLGDVYPKDIEYFNSKMIIDNVYYKDHKLYIDIEVNKDVAYEGGSKLDGKAQFSGGKSSYVSGKEIYSMVYDTEKKDSYDFSLVMMMKYRVPVDIDVSIKENN